MSQNLIIPGELHFTDSEITINADRKHDVIIMENTGDRPIQIGSHYHLYEVNSAVKFYNSDKKEDAERLIAWGKRFDIPSSTSIRFEPNEKKEVKVIEIAGEKAVYGLRNLADGSVKSEPKVPFTKSSMSK